MNFKGIIKLTKTQYDTLMSTGQCVDSQGVTHTYQDGYQYVTDDIDYVDLTSNQGIGGEKTFTDGDTTHDDVVIDYTGVKAENGAGTSSVKLTKTGFTKDGTYSLALPAQNGTLVAGVYKHYIELAVGSIDIWDFVFWSTSSTAYTTIAALEADKSKFLGLPIIPLNTGTGGFMMTFTVSGTDLSISAIDFSGGGHSVSLSNPTVSDTVTQL